jgi:Na+/phosphate symporter
MPTVGDVYDKLKDANTNLEKLKTSVDQVNSTLVDGFGTLVSQGAYTNRALFHESQQLDTAICALEHIAEHTCRLVNEAHTQTGLQTSIEASARELAQLYETTHADAALARERLEGLRAKIEECCPPEPERPPCTYEPCEAPEPLKEPPRQRPT